MPPSSSTRTQTSTMRWSASSSALSISQARVASAYSASSSTRTSMIVSEIYWSPGPKRSEEHTSELQSLMRISYAVFCLKKKTKEKQLYNIQTLVMNTNTNKSKIVSL